MPSIPKQISEYILMGLTQEQVRKNRTKYGANEISSSKKKGIFQMLLGVVMEPMILLLISISIVYLLLGDRGEALLLLCSVIGIITITFIQEKKTETAISALRSLASPRTNVIRDRQILRIEGKDVVFDDLLILNEGDRVPADAELISDRLFSCDESLLTGESVPVTKSQSSPVFCGSLVVSGEGVCRVTAVGNQTEIGKIGRKIADETVGRTLLEVEVARLVRNLFIVAASLCVILALYFGIARSQWLQGLLSGLTLAIGLMPEELPLVMTIFFALGAFRLSTKKVLVRRSSIIETLGAATVLCSDKTGTITQNKMKVGFVVTKSETCELNPKTKQSDETKELLHIAYCASKHPSFDPMDIAISDCWDLLEKKEDSALLSVRDFPLSPDHLTMVRVLKDGEFYVSYAKGSPEAVFDLCSFTGSDLELWTQKTNELAKQGFRVLGVAKSESPSLEIPEERKQAKFRFYGLLAFLDPIREIVPLAVKTAYESGIRVIMITGDYPETAKNIADQIGLKESHLVYTGKEFSNLSEVEMQKVIRKCNIFSRVSPEDKWKIVRMLKADGEIVAMTGDGVNDAPALRTANIGVAMGERGTDVAREAADIVLLDDSFSSILESVRIGRQIFDNLKKALGYLIGVHIPIVGITFFPIIFDWPIVVLSAIHIVFMEMVIDPTCTIVFERESAESDLMKRKPRETSEPLLDRELFINSLIQGAFSLFSVVSSYWITELFLKGNSSPKVVSTATFVTLVFSNLFLILANRSLHESMWSRMRIPNQTIRYVFSGTIGVLMLSMYLPGMNSMFRFVPLNFLQFSTAILVAFVGVLFYDMTKVLVSKSLRS
ncbi:cation-translocating P-type ATPase [Leptospira sp. 2 VSF19]|uniref:Cation-translocating P-type ATPase n=1 Tax=Leptospira soteropolitanensis TaxID=2950025 RepID=A0AAW5VEA3_9LEPT|nr:cation-translocating P-type ATPase [Leptospira soteropolitanensis]MCW7493620.1 cation-translocating P-type ATPase [Leptospira soteropolitanensis]MCW7501219.1 cation-translocating P-type ATPase [Leptospira soteropolitanensis]MCW7523595.1 cation-translocating P-type ATPase [Leptospira soteropolitanensis]MCW7527332.1 cation-translocating P-type ATPase [Leptospira soteropolitanensis]MCW7531189.1 cation-translocating P-type ATPase [Leptospira soteropolitanensis]